jgi:hypothetical protein
MTAASITPNDNLIGASAVTITVSITPKNTLSSTGRIYVDFPFWNPSSASKLDMMQSSSPTCTGVTSNMASSITCAYTTLNRRLTLTNMLSGSSVTGSVLTFTVTDFLNPYSAVPKTGFTVYTADSNGFTIDSKAVTVTVTGWASFTSADFDRQDGITTVNELS